MMDHEEYLKRRDELLGIRTDSFGSFDRAILSLATGSLALSITFLDKIGEPYDLLTYFLIILAWICFFLVILFNLASYLFAKSNMNRKIADLDRRYKKELDTGEIDKNPEPRFWQNFATSMCNTCAFILFFIGVVFFTIYIINIQIRNYEEIQLSKTKETIMSDFSSNLKGGKTESSQTISKPSPKPASQSGDFTTHGLTEAPQAVMRPEKPPGKSGGGSEKTE